MRRRLLTLAAAASFLTSPVFAQGSFEASAFCGWTVVDGFALPAPASGNSAYTRADPQNSASFGFTFGATSDLGLGVEFLWGRQATTLDVTGAGPPLSGRMNIDSYHVHVVYEFGERENRSHLFVLGGLGATHYGDVVLPPGRVAGKTRFSWAFGGGLKVYPSSRVGFRVMARFVPTYIDAGETGLRCDLTPDCWANSSAANSIQIEFTGGVLVRF